jgi:hypothetical protein
MFPNYTTPPPVAVQRTLKALAKPIMSLAFLVEASEQNQQDKATNDFVEVGTGPLATVQADVGVCRKIPPHSQTFWKHAPPSTTPIPSLQSTVEQKISPQH